MERSWKHSCATVQEPCHVILGFIEYKWCEPHPQAHAASANSLFFGDRHCSESKRHSRD